MTAGEEQDEVLPRSLPPQELHILKVSVLLASKVTAVKKVPIGSGGFQKLVRKLSGDKKYSESDVPTEEKLRVLVEHCELFEKLLLDVKSFAVMKKHFKAYTHGFPGAKELRVKLMETNNAFEVKGIVENFLKK